MSKDTVTVTVKPAKLIKGRLGKGLLTEVYGGKTFMESFIEITKNSRDWGATIITVDTTDKSKMVIFDNGKGMDESNRTAYVSMREDVKREGFVSGKFDTGAKFMLFSHADIVVRTVAHNDPNTICVFEIQADDYEAKAITNNLEFSPTFLVKNAQNWPYDSQTGTELTLKFRNPNKPSIRRGITLAEELSARLPIKFSDFVLVNGVNIPQKKIKGIIYSEHHDDPLLKGKNCKGFVDMELYNPENRRSEDELRMAPHEVGEVTLKELLKRIPANLASEVPTVYLLDICCGTIICPFLGEYSDQDRKTFKPDIAGDPRIPQLIQILKLYAPQVEQAFGIVRSSTMSKAEESDLNDLLEICNEAYNVEMETQRVIEESVVNSSEGTINPSKYRDVRAKNVVSLHASRHEIEVGESFDVQIKMSNSAFAKKIDPKSFLWNVNDIRATVKSYSSDGLMVTLIAKQEGNGRISVDLPGTSISASEFFTVVRHRTFRLTRSHMTTNVLGEVPVIAMNTDKLKGPISWRWNGPIVQVKKYEHKIEFKATGPGQATVYATDTCNPKVSDQCTITISKSEAKQAKSIVIRDKRFTLENLSNTGRLVSFVEQIGDTGVMVVNFNSENYQVASGLGGKESLHLLVQQMAFEFARSHFVNSKEIADRRDFKTITEQINVLSDSVYLELMGIFRKKISNRK